jgi:hypothetical protein
VLFLLLENCSFLAIRAVVDAMKQTDAQGNIGGICGSLHTEPVGAGGNPRDFAEQRAKRSQTFKANSDAYLGNRQISCTQKLFSSGDTLLHEVLMGRLPVNTPEQPYEVIR